LKGFSGALCIIRTFYDATQLFFYSLLIPTRKVVRRLNKKYWLLVEAITVCAVLLFTAHLLPGLEHLRILIPKTVQTMIIAFEASAIWVFFAKLIK
jgi:hypothetical protein